MPQRLSALAPFAAENREVKKTHETRRVRVRPESLVNHS